MLRLVHMFALALRFDTTLKGVIIRKYNVGAITGPWDTLIGRNLKEWPLAIYMYQLESDIESLSECYSYHNSQDVGELILKKTQCHRL